MTLAALQGEPALIPMLSEQKQDGNLPGEDC
jgi:hypothetical protein